MDINQLTEQFKTYEELKVFCSSQFKQILQLTKKIKELEEKNSSLQKKVKEVNNSEVINLNAALPSTSLNFKLLDDAKMISQVQLKMIKELSFERELTLEETKKLDIFNRILNQPEDKEKPIKATARVLKEEDLLSLVEGNGK